MNKLTLNDREKIAVYASEVDRITLPELSNDDATVDVTTIVYECIKSLEKLAGDM